MLGGFAARSASLPLVRFATGTNSLLGIIEFLLLPCYTPGLADVDIDTVDLFIVGGILNGVRLRRLARRRPKTLTLNRF